MVRKQKTRRDVGGALDCPSQQLLALRQAPARHDELRKRRKNLNVVRRERQCIPQMPLGILRPPLLNERRRKQQPCSYRLAIELDGRLQELPSLPRLVGGLTVQRSGQKGPLVGGIFREQLGHGALAAFRIAGSGEGEQLQHSREQGVTACTPGAAHELQRFGFSSDNAIYPGELELEKLVPRVESCSLLEIGYAPLHIACQDGRDPGKKPDVGVLRRRASQRGERFQRRVGPSLSQPSFREQLYCRRVTRIGGEHAQKMLLGLPQSPLCKLDRKSVV